MRPVIEAVRHTIRAAYKRSQYVVVDVKRVWCLNDSQGGVDWNPYTGHVALSSFISYDWARFQSLYILSLLQGTILSSQVCFSYIA